MPLFIKIGDTVYNAEIIRWLGLSTKNSSARICTGYSQKGEPMVLYTTDEVVKAIMEQLRSRNLLIEVEGNTAESPHRPGE